MGKFHLFSKVICPPHDNGGVLSRHVIIGWLVRIFNAVRHPRHIEAAAIVMYMYLYSLAFTHAHLVPLSVTKRRPVHLILNPGHVMS